MATSLAPAVPAHRPTTDPYRVLADIAGELVAVPVGRLDAALPEALRRLGEHLDLDACAVLVPDDGPSSLRVAHSWSRRAASSMVAIRGRRGAAEDGAPGPDAAATVPMDLGRVSRGAMTFVTADPLRQWTPAELDCFRVVTGLVGQALARQADRDGLDCARAEALELRERLGGDAVVLRGDAKAVPDSGLIVGESLAIGRVLAQVEQVARTPATVLLLGETGSGKEVFAQHVHALSARRGRPMVRVSCSAIPAALIESELFGRERGAYTGAISRQVGRFELAHQSTIFLDEIGELPLDMQVKLLRVLQERTIERLGGSGPIKVDVRIIAATNRNLERAVEQGTFREDLYYRLNVFPMTVPPLREHPEDIPALVWSFVDEFSRRFGKEVDAISKDSLAALQRYHWPGNVRELRNLVERAMIVATGPRLTITPPASAAPATRPSGSTRLADIETQHIRAMLDAAGWRIRGPRGAAELLGVKPTTLESRMAKLGIARPRGRTAEASLH